MKHVIRGAIVLAVILSSSVYMVQAGSFFKIGQPAPDFTLTSLEGQPVSLSKLKGKVVVLGLFHICEPCLMQGTNLQKVHEATQGKAVSVVGVNSSGDSKADVSEFLQSFPVKVTYPYLVDPDQVTDKAYGGGKFIPNVYVIDQEGTIRWQRVGNFFTDGKLAGHEVILQEVNKLLAGQGTPATM